MDLFTRPVTICLIFMACFDMNLGVLTPKKDSKFPAIAKMTSKSHPMLASVFASANIAKATENKPTSIKESKTTKEELQVPPKGIDIVDSKPEFVAIHASILCKMCQEKNDLACIERHCWNSGNTVTGLAPSGAGFEPTSQGGTKLGPITHSTNMLPDRKHPNKDVIKGSIEGPVIVPLQPEIQSGVGLPSGLMHIPGFIHPLSQLVPDNVRPNVIDKAMTEPESIVNVVPLEPTIQHGVGLPSVLSDPIVANPIATENDKTTAAETNFIPIAMPNTFSEFMKNKPLQGQVPVLRPFKSPFQQISELSPFQLDAAIVNPSKVDTNTDMVDRSMADVKQLPKTFSEFINMKEFQGEHKTSAIIPASLLDAPGIDNSTHGLVASGEQSPIPSGTLEHDALAPLPASGQPSITFQDVVNLEQILADLMVGTPAMTGTQDLSVSNILENNLSGVNVLPNGVSVNTMKEVDVKTNGNTQEIVLKSDVNTPTISLNADINKPVVSIKSDMVTPEVDVKSELNQLTMNDITGVNGPIFSINTDQSVPSVNVKTEAKANMGTTNVNTVSNPDTQNFDNSNFFIPSNFDMGLNIPDGLSALPMEPISFVPLNPPVEQISQRPSEFSLDPISESASHSHGSHSDHAHTESGDALSHTDIGTMTNNAPVEVVSVVSAGEPAVFARERQRQLVEASDLPTTTPIPFPEETTIVTMNPVRKAELHNFAQSFIPTKN